MWWYQSKGSAQWSPERLLLWLFGILLLTATVFHPWYILWILPFAAAQRNAFWLVYAAMQIFGLWPYYRQAQGLRWQEIAGLKWFLIAIPILIWLLVQFQRQSKTRSSLTP
jgi:hypothetical protein